MSQPTPPSFQPAHPTNTPSGQPLPPTLTAASSDNSYQNNPFTLALEGIGSLFTYVKPIAIALLVVGLLTFAGNAASTAADIYTANNPEATPSAETSGGDFDMSLLIVTGLIVFAVSVVVFIIVAIFKGAGEVAAAAAANQEKLSFGQTFSRLFARLPGYLLLQLLIIIKVLGWTLLFIIPGIVMSIRYSLAGTAYFARNMSAGQALRHSVSITKGGWITTFGSLGLFNLVTLGALPLLVQTGVQSALFRQFDAYAQKGLQKPGPHGLSIAYLILCLVVTTILLASVAIVLIMLIASREL